MMGCGIMCNPSLTCDVFLYACVVDNFHVCLHTIAPNQSMHLVTMSMCTHSYIIRSYAHVHTLMLHTSKAHHEAIQPSEHTTSVYKSVNNL